MNDFYRDEAEQREIRDRFLSPFYETHSFGGRYVHLDKGRCASLIQKRFSVDTVVQSQKTGGAVVCEEKIVRWKGYAYTAYALETDSCTVPGLESEGWMRYGEAELLNYCFRQKGDHQLLLHMIDFQKLKVWFWPRYDQFPKTITEQCNRTLCRVVPIDAVRDAGLLLAVRMLP